jgi:hypothetical protein
MKDTNPFLSNVKEFFQLIEIRNTLFLLFIVFLGGCIHQVKIDSLSFLKTQEQDIVNGEGEKILLRGVGLGNWLLPEGYMWKFGNEGDRPRKIEKVVENLIGKEQAAIFWKEFRANYITEADIERIAALGFNSVRVALNSRLFITEDEIPVFNEEGFMHLQNLVTWCKKHHVYIIIDMHAAPGGQTGANIDDSPNDLPELFMDAKNEDALVKLWLEIARIYKDEPTVAAYDLLNEPLPERTGAAEKYGHLVEPMYKKLTTEIRKIDSLHMITIEGVDWANDWSIFGEPFDNNLIYQFHYYCWNNPEHLNSIDQYLAYRDTLNAPVWVGETGEKASNIYWATTQLFEENNIGWSFWPWKKMDTQNTPYSINKPANWELIADYTRGGEKPDSATSQLIFNEMLDLIKLQNCEYFEDVTHAIFRMVPGKVEAENYMHGANNQAYFVNDTSEPSKYYRTTEFVPVVLSAIDSTSHKWKWFTEQAIVLSAGEWTTYEINSTESEVYDVRLRVKAEELPLTIQFEKGEMEDEFEVTSSDWLEVELNEWQFSEGKNTIKFTVIEGKACIDWFDFTNLQ